MLFRKPRFSDVIAMQDLINVNADQGLMLPRSRNAIYETLRDFTVAEYEGRIIGVGALHIIWDEMAEVRALAIAPDAKRQGIGRKIVGLLIDEAKALGVKQVFALTYQPDFFIKCGFTEVAKDNLPHKVWKECINCPKFPNCDEVALILNLE
jgi:amino-acid N-acetyltransferase